MNKPAKQPERDGVPLGAWGFGITLPRTKAGYLLFLQTDFWKTLRRLKRKECPNCEICGSKYRLHIHHVFYRDNWFDTRLEDLQTLCHWHHDKVHHLKSKLLIKKPDRHVSDEEMRKRYPPVRPK